MFFFAKRRWEMSDERTDTIALAHVLLDQPWADPDDDLRMLARQFLRGEERIAQLKAELAKVYEHNDYNAQERRKLEAAHDRAMFIATERKKQLIELRAAVRKLVDAYDNGGTWFANDVAEMRELLTASETKADVCPEITEVHTNDMYDYDPDRGEKR
jgi:hypothetical protein